MPSFFFGGGEGEDQFFFSFLFFSFEELFLFPLGYRTFSGLELLLCPSLPSIYRGNPGKRGGLETTLIEAVRPYLYGPDNEGGSLAQK